MKEYLKIFKKYPPSILDELISVCPFYKPCWRGSTIYKTIHDFARNRIAAKLLAEGYSIEIERRIEFGRIDILVGLNGKSLAIVEVKTGDVKLLQVAAYSTIMQLPALIAELKTGNVIVLSLEKSIKLLDELIKHLRDIERLKEKGVRITGSECYRCGSECENRRNRSGSLSLNTLNALNNIECVFDQLIEKLREIVKNE
ncbi:hypothetical protein DRP05_07495 [Archaeoglobales archaeon]|nr:MAG: hypothetical protein DRP05_07495 [Archaeoglobales archaeon]